MSNYRPFPVVAAHALLLNLPIVDNVDGQTIVISLETAEKVIINTH